MSIFSFIGKIMAIWAEDGPMFEEMADVYRKHQAAKAAGAPVAPAKPSEVANEIRKAAGAAPMTPSEKEKFDAEQAWMNRTR